MALRAACLAALLALAAVAAAAAGDAAHLDGWGWSASGRYVTPASSGVEDGSGLAYASRVVVDAHTARQVLLVARRQREDSQDGANVGAIRRQVERAARDALRRYGLAHPLPGTVLLYRPLPPPAGPGVWGSGGRGERIAFAWRGRGYVLRLVEEVRGDAQRDPYAVRGRLVVTLDGSGGRRVLYRDAGWTTRYRHAVRVLTAGPGGETVAAVIAAWSVGFEGPDVRYLVVAGPLR